MSVMRKFLECSGPKQFCKCGHYEHNLATGACRHCKCQMYICRNCGDPHPKSDAKIVLRLKDAHTGFCLDCQIGIGPSLYWGLRQSIGLHESGSGSKACRIVLYRTHISYCGEVA